MGVDVTRPETLDGMHEAVIRHEGELTPDEVGATILGALIGWAAPWDAVAEARTVPRRAWAGLLRAEWVDGAWEWRVLLYRA